MILSLSARQIRLSDEYTINTLGVPSLLLMERAGGSIAERVEAVLKEKGGGAVLAVCGGGNNGGDGFVAARLLSEKEFSVTVLLLSGKLSPDEEAVKNMYGGEIISSWNDKKYAVIIDCIFGTGLKRNVEGVYADVIDKINKSGAYVISADIPSGINGENGLKMGSAVNADETVTIGEYKNGLVLSDGRDCAGKIFRADIGITVVGDKNTYIVEGADVKELFPKRRSNSHKGTFGRAAIVGGSLKYSGAPYLSALAALNCGAGYTRLCVPHAVFPHFIGKAPELILSDMGGEENLILKDELFSPLLSSDAVAVGMGADVGQSTYGVVKYFLDNYAGILIIDADGINSLAKYGADILLNARCRVILTPHIKEFSRLTGRTVEDILSDPTEAAKSFSKRYGVTLVLKSNSCIITDGATAYITASAPPSLAKGGSGDVLSGIICALCAEGNPPLKSAYAGAYLLGAAAKQAEESISEYSVKATDVINSIGAALKRLCR